MKLIIDIPDNVYIACNEYKDNTNIGILQRILYIAISNGIPLEEELEKIKAELNNKCFAYSLTDNFENDIIICVIKVSDMEKIIDKHIYKLKGENNPDCRNCDKWKTCENGEKGHANGTSIGYSIGECRDYVELKGE